MTDLSGTLKKGSPAERKQLVGMCMEKIKLAPEDLAVEIFYRLPEPVMNSVVGGPATRQCENALNLYFYGSGHHPEKVDIISIFP